MGFPNSSAGKKSTCNVGDPGSIPGLGRSSREAAEGIVEAVKDGPFLSQDNFRERTKCTKTVTETLARLGLLGDLPESNQISLFDFV